jgi:GntR family transcriptional regulator, transcriptional repressor for pyruvate dehydrogenase complex
MSDHNTLPKSAKFSSLKTKRLPDQIADQIKENIYSGVFRPGDKLPSERELAGQFDSGRTVVREALRELEQSGLIVMKQGSFGGAFVKNIDATVMMRSITDMVKIGTVKLWELTQARISVEKSVLELAIPNIEVNELSLLEENLRTTEKDLQREIRALDHNTNFHMLLARFANNSLLAMFVQSAMYVMANFIRLVEPGLDSGRCVLNYHQSIYEAVKKKDIELAKERMGEHILDIEKDIAKLYGVRNGTIRE